MALDNVGDKQYVTSSRYVYLKERIIKDDSTFICEASSEVGAKKIATSLNEVNGY